MKRISLGLAATLATVSLASAQIYRDGNGFSVLGVAPMVGCSANGACSAPVSATNPLPVSGSFSANTNVYQPSAAGTPLSASTASSRVALPAGTTVVVYNTGSSAAYVAFGGASVVATSANDAIPPNSWIAFAPGSATFLAAITASGTTTLNVSGGTGLPAGAGSGGGSSGAVAQGSAAAAAGAWPVYETLGGAAVSATNGLFVNPATGANFPVSGSVSITGTPNVAVTAEIGAGPTGATVPAGAQFAGMSVGGNLVGMAGTANGLKVDGSAVTQPVSVAGTPNVAVTSEIGAGPTGAAVPSAAQFAGMSVGGNLVGLTGTANGLKVDGSAVTQPVSVTGTATISGAVTQGTAAAAAGAWPVYATLGGSAVSATNPLWTADQSGLQHATGFCRITVTTASATFASLLSGGSGGTCSVPSWATSAQITPEDASTISLRYAADGTTLGATLGAPLFGYFKNPIPAGTAGGSPFTGLSLISAAGYSVTADVEFLQ